MEDVVDTERTQNCDDGAKYEEVSNCAAAHVKVLNLCIPLTFSAHVGREDELAKQLILWHNGD